MLIDRIAYYTGQVIVDMVVYSIGGTGTIVALNFSEKLSPVAVRTMYTSFSTFATSHAINKTEVGAITDNLFNCLEFLD